MIRLQRVCIVIFMEKNDLLKELMQELNWYERILAKLFGNFIIKIYNISRIKIVNEMIK